MDGNIAEYNRQWNKMVLGILGSRKSSHFLEVSKEGLRFDRMEIDKPFKKL
jgi:hypothetical protein